MTYYSPALDPRVEATIELMHAAIKAGAAQRHAENFADALEATIKAATAAQVAIYDLASALVTDGAEVPS